MSRVTERHVQAVWYDAALRPDGLLTRRGSAVRVVSPGEWNCGPGPDFLRAVLEIGPAGERRTGDVEVHLLPADWDRHRHGDDPAYRGVIAHVTWSSGPEPKSLPPGAVSIWLGRFLSGSPSFSPDMIDLGAYPLARLSLPERPCELRFRGDPDGIHRLLAAAGRTRLAGKAGRFANLMHVREDHRQCFYEEVMAALGYSRNPGRFRSVARRIPFSLLAEEPSLARESFLAAGDFEDWDATGCRPDNQPIRRLANAADIVTRTPLMGLPGAVDFSPAALRRMMEEICFVDDGEGRRRCLGRGRAAAIIANVIVPWAIASRRLTAPGGYFGAGSPDGFAHPGTGP